MLDGESFVTITMSVRVYNNLVESFYKGQSARIWKISYNDFRERTKTLRTIQTNSHPGTSFNLVLVTSGFGVAK